MKTNAHRLGVLLRQATNVIGVLRTALRKHLKETHDEFGDAPCRHCKRILRNTGTTERRIKRQLKNKSLQTA